MFKKLKEKITEEVKSSPQRFAEFTQSVSDRLQNSSTSDDNFFSIGDDDHNMSTNSNSSNQGFSSVSLVSPSQESRSRKLSNSSMASDVSFLPRYEAGSMYHLQSDLDVSASEIEDNASSSSQLGHLSKEQIYSAFQKSQMRYHKYRGRYTDLARHYKELERENSKMKSVLVETQDKALRRVQELREQCKLEQEAKAHLEMALRDEIDEKDYKIKTLQTKIELLQNDSRSSSLNTTDTKETDSQTDNNNLENLTKYLSDARKEIEILNEKIQELKATTIVYQSKEQENKLKLLSLEKEIAQYVEREKEYNLKFAQNKMELHNEILSKETEITNMKKDIEVLKQKIEISENDNKLGNNVKLENLQTQNKKLIDRLENLTQKCNGLENELLKVNSYKIEIENAKKKELDLVKEIEAGVSENEKLQKSLKHHKEELDNLTANITKERQDFEHQISILREDAKNSLLSLEPKIRGKLQNEYLLKEDELKQDFMQKLNDISSNNSSQKEIELQQFENENIIKQISEELLLLKDELCSKLEAYNNLEKDHLELIEDCQKLRSKISHLEKANISIDNFEQKNFRLEAHIKTLQDEMRSFKEAIAKKERENMLLCEEKSNLQELLDEYRERSLELGIANLEENMALRDHKGFKENEKQACLQKAELKSYNEKIIHLEHLLNEERIKNTNLFDKKVNYKVDNIKLAEKIRIIEEKEEADEINKFECSLLEMKLKKLEDEKQQLIQTFEQEREICDKHLEQLRQGLEQNLVEQEEINVDDKLKTKILDIRRICSKKDQEIIYLSKENEDLIQKTNKLSEDLRLAEEKCECLQLEGTEGRLFELKYRNLEEEHSKLQEEFEMERKMFTGLLENHKEIQEKNEMIDKLNEQILEGLKEISNLKDVLEKQKLQMINVEKQKLQLESELDELRHKLEETDKSNDSNKSEYNLLMIKLEKLEVERQHLLDSFEQERSTFKEICANKEKEMKTLCNKINDLDQNIKKYQENINKLEKETKTFNIENVQLKEHSDELRNKNKNLQFEKEELLKDINEKNKQVSELSGKMSSLSEVIEKQTAEFNKLLTRTQELDGILESMNKENADVIKKEKQRQNELTSKIEDLQKELESKSLDLANLNEKLIDVEKLYQQEHHNHNAKLREFESINRKLLEMQTLQENYQKLENEKQIVCDELSKLQLLEKEKIALKSKLDETEKDLKTRTNNLRIKDQECLIFKNERDSLLGEIENLREKLSSLNTENSNLKVVSSQASEDKQKLCQIQAECENLRITNEKLIQEISELTSRLKQISTDNKNFVDENQTLLSEKEELKIKLEVLVKEKANFDETAGKIRNENEELLHKVEELTKNLIDMQRQTVDLVNEKGQLNLNDELSKVQKDFYEIKEKCDNLTVENKNLKLDYAKLEEKCNEFSSSKQTLETQIRELESHYTEISHEKQLLQDEVNELKISPVSYQENTSSKLDQLDILKKEQELKTSNSDKQTLLQEIEILHDKLTKYKSLDLTNKSSIEFYENELQKMKNQNDKLNRKLDETLVTLNHCAELSSSTEVEYLRNILYNYMLGKESLVLARVIAAVCKFDPQQTDLILQKEQQKQTLLGHLGLI